MLFVFGDIDGTLFQCAMFRLELAVFSRQVVLTLLT